MTCASLSQAQFTWDGGGTTNNFNDALNWTSDVAPTGATGTTYTFAGTTRLTANNNITLTGADNSIVFDATAGAFTLTGNAVRSGGVTNNSLVEQTIGLNLRLNGTRTFNTGAAGIRLTSLVTSTGTSGRGLTKTGTGNLTIATTGTSNLISYTVNANSGNLVLENSTGTLTIPTLTTINSGSGLILAQAGIANLSGGIAGAGSLSKTGAGSSTLTGTVNYTGGTTVQSGILTYGTAFTMSGNNSISAAGAFSPVAGTSYGQVAATTGSFSYGGTLSINFTGTAQIGATYNLFDFTGATQSGTFTAVNIANAYTAALTNTAGVWSGESGAFQFKFTESTGDLEILSAIPEPSSFAAFAGLVGVAAVGLRRRRRA